MKYLSSLFVLLFCTLGIFAQQKFDMLWYTTPAGWDIQNTGKQLTLIKKELPGAQILVYPSVPVGRNADADFNEQWKKYVKGVYRGVADSFTVDVQSDGDWNYYSTYSYASINKKEVVIAFTCLRSKTSLISIVNVLPDETCLAEVNAFLGGLEIEEGSGAAVSHAKIFRRKRVAMKSKRPKFRPGKGLRDAVN